MVIVEYNTNFSKTIKKIKNSNLKIKVKKQLKKIIENPKIGKPMKHSRKGTREVYISPFRLAYAFLEKEDKIILLTIYHKDEQ